jgi:hypothetical protein
MQIRPAVYLKRAMWKTDTTMPVGVLVMRTVQKAEVARQTG